MQNSPTIRRIFSASVFTLIFLFPLALSAQMLEGKAASDRISGAARVWINERNQSVKYVDLSGVQIKETEHLDWINKHVKPTQTETDLQLFKREKDLQGYMHYRYRQYYKGVRVEYGVVYAHHQGGKLLSVNGELYPQINLDVAPQYSAETAFEKALKHYPCQQYQFIGKDGKPKLTDSTELLVLPLKTGGYKLAYKVDVYTAKPLRRVWVYLDAQTGDKLLEMDRIHHTDVTGTANTAYNGTRSITTDQTGTNSFRLNASKGFGGVNTYNMNNTLDYDNSTEFTDADNVWDATDLERYAYDAHYGAESTYEYYLTRYGRNSFDNAGAAINSYVHYDVDYVNAFWDGARMTYGDGDGVTYNPLTSIDVVGHEITHAVTQHTANLVYMDESGALNESFSDIFGAAIDYYRNPSTANFLMGDQPSLGGDAFRDMSNPNVYDNPDTYNGTFWNNPNEVHNNSGVQNYWFYLLSMGGSGVNDLGDNYSVAALGIDKAGAVAYRSLSTYLTPNSNYNDARIFAILSAADLYGACSNEVIQVTEAWYAVGLGTPYNPNTVANFQTEVYSNCIIPAAVEFQNLSINADTFQWDFGDGQTSTDKVPVHTYQASGSYTVRLIASSANCASADTIIRVHYVNVYDGGGTLTAACSPVTLNYCCGSGITRVQLASLDKTSGDGEEGYQDYSCTDFVLVGQGDTVPLQITTGDSFEEDVFMYIDYNNDGSFDTTELVFNSINVFMDHIGEIKIPMNAVTNTPLRMRVMSDWTNRIKNSCTNVRFGQVEDYAITIIPDNDLPVAEFVADKRIIGVGESVQFTDLSFHNPTAWSWNLNGADPAFTTDQHPLVVYNFPGVYPASLTVSNAFGSDSKTKQSYIEVIQSYTMCKDTASTEQSGILYDSGGASGDYANNENCTFEIAPNCKGPVQIEFLEFNMFNLIDRIRVTDGSNMILFQDGGTNMPGPIISQDGILRITFTSNSANTASGFKAIWRTLVEPTTATGFAATASASGGMDFIILDSDSSHYTYFWDFGDLSTSTDAEPNHDYAGNGCYIVKLTLTDTLTDCSEQFSQEVCVNEEVPPSKVIIYPNPSADWLTLKLPANPIRFEVTDIHGKQVTPLINQTAPYVYQLDLRQLADATYFIRIDDEVYKVMKFTP